MRWALCESKNWRNQDGTWNAKDFYVALMELFGIGYEEGVDSPDDADPDPALSSRSSGTLIVDEDWVQETLDWWNE